MANAGSSQSTPTVYFFHIFYQVIKLTSAIILLASLGCTTPEPSEQVKEPIRTHYKLRRGTSIIYPEPLPNLTEIFVDWHYNTGSVQSTLGFRGWDINGDTRIDMLEILDQNGLILKTAFDFDYDGVVDHEQ